MSIQGGVSFNFPGGEKGFKCFYSSLAVQAIIAILFWGVWMTFMARDDKAKKDEKFRQYQIITGEIRVNSQGEEIRADADNNTVHPREASVSSQSRTTYNPDFQFPPSQTSLALDQRDLDYLKVLDPGMYAQYHASLEQDAGLSTQKNRVQSPHPGEQVCKCPIQGSSISSVF